jgi:hypothetical protein
VRAAVRRADASDRNQSALRPQDAIESGIAFRETPARIGQHRFFRRLDSGAIRLSPPGDCRRYAAILP